MAANEFGRLAYRVYDRIKETNTMRFISKKDVPQDRTRDVTYTYFLCKVRNEKKEMSQTRLVIGGDCTNYTGEVATPTKKCSLPSYLSSASYPPKEHNS